MELDHDSSSVSSSSSNLHSPSHYSSSAASEPPEVQISHKRRAGRKKFRETRHPIYRGVRQRGNGGKWVCEVRVPNMKSRVWVGTFSTAEMAARGHDVAMLALKGKAAVLNFDDSAWVLPRAKSASARDIQVAAAEAVEVLKAHAMALPMSPSCSSTGTKNAEEAALVESQSGCNMFLDEEAMFNLPGLLHSMAEGLLMTPPFLVQQNELGWGGVDSHLEYLSLWSD